MYVIWLSIYATTTNELELRLSNILLQRSCYYFGWTGSGYYVILNVSINGPLLCIALAPFCCVFTILLSLLY